VADRYGDGPAVVLLHGQPGSAGDWNHVVPHLSRDFTLVVPDRLGYGRTGGGAGGFSANAEAVAALLDRLEIRRALLAGHSWGGGAALAFAEAYPERVTGLALISSVGPGERFGLDDRLLAAPVLGEALAALTIGVAGRLLASSWVQGLARRRLSGRAREAVGVLTSLTGAHTGAAVWRSFVVEQRALLYETDGLGATIQRVAVPTTIVHGSADHVVPVGLAEQLAAAIPGAHLVVVAGANHLVPHRYPSVVAGAVRQVASRAEVSGRLNGEETAHGEG
jgi:pimeloyl-ACP methyl ester carboxylesterase